MNTQISKIVSNILMFGYTQINDFHYEKQEEQYISILKLELLNKNTINFILARKYNTNDRLYYIFNQKRRIGKLLNVIQQLLQNEKYQCIENDDSFIHVEIVCCCETYDKNSPISYPGKEALGLLGVDLYKINIDNFGHIQGLINIHGVENGRCFVLLNRESADNFASIIKQELEQHAGIQIKSCFKDHSDSDKMDIICCVLDNQ